MVSTAELTYRSRAFATIGWSMLALVALVVASLVLARPSPAWLWLPLAVIGGGGVGWLIYRCYVAPRVVSSERGVRVVNPFRTTDVRWADVERFEPRPMLTIVRRDGTTLSAWAVQHAETVRLVGRTSQGEPVTTALTRQLAAATLPPPAP